MPRLELVVMSQADANEELRRAIREWLLSVWGSPGGDGIRWAAPQWHVMAMLDDVAVSHVGVVQREIEVGGCPYSVAGICAVTTKPAWTGNGYASHAMEHATAFARESLGVDHCLLECEPEMVPFYARLGWREIAEHPVCELPNGKGTVGGHVAMVFGCGGRPWPEGAIDLRGLPW